MDLVYSKRYIKIALNKVSEDITLKTVKVTIKHTAGVQMTLQTLEDTSFNATVGCITLHTFNSTVEGGSFITSLTVDETCSSCNYNATKQQQLNLVCGRVFQTQAPPPPLF